MRATACLSLLLLSTSCSGGGGESTRGAAAATAPAASSAIRGVPRIWVVAVGVSDYKTEGLALEFANRDAAAIDGFFASDEGGRVPDERRVLLTDAKATRASVLTALTGLSRRTAPEDMIVIFLAMHGMPDAGGDLYYLAHDTDPKELVGTGLPQRDLEYAISRAPARRVVLLADACHAGAAGFEGFRGRRSAALAETDRLVGQLAESKPGTAVLTASSATEASAEGKKWGGGHGVFTHHLLAGLSGDADADTDGFVTIRELFDFTYRHVSKDTGGDQHPELKGRFDNAMPLAALPGARRRVAGGGAVAGGRGVPDPSTPLRASETATVAADLEAACRKETKSGKSADPDACALIGGMMVRGEGVQTDPRRGWGILTKACGDGSSRACCTAAELAYDPNEPSEGAEVAVCARACDEDSAHACRALETMRRAGGPRAADPKASERSRRARQLDESNLRAPATPPRATASRRCCSRTGTPPARPAPAPSWSNRATPAWRGAASWAPAPPATAARAPARCSKRRATRGWRGPARPWPRPTSTTAAARPIRAARTTPSDGRATRAWSRRAARAPSWPRGPRGGRSTPPSACSARATRTTSAPACRLGGMYENGEGVAKSSTLAFSFYMRACARGNQTACKRRDALKNSKP